MNIREFLSNNKLTVVWLCDQLSRRGIAVRREHLSRIISGERNSPFAAMVRAESVDILRQYKQYQKGISNAKTFKDERGEAI